MEQFFVTFIGTFVTLLQVVWFAFVELLPTTFGEALMFVPLLVVVGALIYLAVSPPPFETEGDNRRE